MKKITALSEKVNKHHIYPVSRMPYRKRDKSNIKKVPISYHQAYHHLFANMSPPEIIDYLKLMWFENNKFIKPEKWIEMEMNL